VNHPPGVPVGSVWAQMTRLFPLWALVAAASAILWPDPWAARGSWVVPLLMSVMFGMGVTLTPADFRRVVSQPTRIAVGTSLQFLVMPLAALLTGWLLRLPPELVAGLVVVGACPGGTASNVICYLARADVALSIGLTFVSTLLAVVLTPGLIWLYLGQAVPVPVSSMLGSLVQLVLLPVVVGMLVNTYLRRPLQGVLEVFPFLSVVAIGAVIGIVVGLNRSQLLASGGWVALAVVVHNLLGLGAGYGVARALRLPESASRTIAIEVGMQNSGLGVALALQYFSPLTALPGAIFSVWHNVSGSLLAGVWRRRDRRGDSEAGVP
jgi:bile acid:Na+ symporter, BASS family